MHLSPRELDKLTLHQASFLAQKRLARGIRLNHPEAVALIATVLLEFIRDGKSVAELDKDVQDLLTKWKGAFELLKTAKPPQKILGELNRTSTILRDLLNASLRDYP